MVEPIKPSEVVGSKAGALPDVVIETFNRLIAENWRDGRSVVLQREAVAALVSSGLDEQEIYERGWLDVEDVYRRAGWSVEYDKPAFNESYPASFTFKKKGAR